MHANIKPVLLIIRDGWGINPDPKQAPFNAVQLAATPIADRLSRECPRTELNASGRDVGLPDGIMGNSEVGHQNIGAGRIVDQELLRIDKAFETGAIHDNATLRAAFNHIKQTNGRLHLLGLASDAGVHATLNHLFGLLGIAKAENVAEVFIHAFTDGRDTSPYSGLEYVRRIEAHCRKIGLGRIATVCGRFWSMDRDFRWERVQRAYTCLTGLELAATATNAEAAIQHYYANPLDDSRQGDEFVLPTTIVDTKGTPIGTLRHGDAAICYNFRGDRPRQMTRALTEEEFKGFQRPFKLDLFYATMTEYQKGLCPHILFPKPPKMANILGAYLAEKGVAQFRCAETEKYPHVTFFFNDYREDPFAGEKRMLISSPKDVPTYDMKPEMSASAVSKATCDAMLSGKYGLGVVNFANPDMVGHTGSLKAAIRACAFVDSCVGNLLKAADQKGVQAVITSDHGNAEQMRDPLLKKPHTAHTLNRIELVVYGRGCADLRLRPEGRLADIAPTVLELMKLPIPKEMTGRSLIISSPIPDFRV